MGIFITKDYIAKQVIQNVVKKETGLGLSIEKVKLGILNADIEIENFNLFNPKNFSNKALAKIPRIYLNYDLHGLLRNKVHFIELVIYLEELLVERNESGNINIKDIEISKRKKISGTKEAVKGKSQINSEKISTDKESIDLQIDKLHLIIDRIIYIDAASDKDVVFNINLDKTFVDITDIKQLRTLIITQLAIPIGLDNIKNLDLDNIEGLLEKNQGKIKEQLEKLENTAKDFIKNL